MGRRCHCRRPPRPAAPTDLGPGRLDPGHAARPDTYRGTQCDRPIDAIRRGEDRPGSARQGRGCPGDGRRSGGTNPGSCSSTWRSGPAGAPSCSASSSTACTKRPSSTCRDGRAEVVEVRVPDRVCASMQQRLERTSEGARQVAIVAASLGRRFSLDAVAAMLGVATRVAVAAGRRPSARQHPRRTQQRPGVLSRPHLRGRQIVGADPGPTLTRPPSCDRASRAGSPPSRGCSSIGGQRGTGR